MTVYVAVSDESSDATKNELSIVAGYSAPRETWVEVFEPAWREWVLDPKPAIPYLHMTQIRSPRWREKHGLSWLQAENRLDAAVRIIRSTGALIPVSLSIDPRHHKTYTDLLVNPRGKQYARHPLRQEQICQGIFSLMQLQLVATRDPSVERVDFCIEANGPTTAHMRFFHASLPAALERIGESHLIPLVGTFEEVRKSDIRAQAADVLAWHARRTAPGSDCERGDERRFSRLVNRFGHRGHVSEDVLKHVRTEADRQTSGQGQ